MCPGSWALPCDHRRERRQESAIQATVALTCVHCRPLVGARPRPGRPWCRCIRRPRRRQSRGSSLPLCGSMRVPGFGTNDMIGREAVGLESWSKASNQAPWHNSWSKAPPTGMPAVCAGRPASTCSRHPSGNRSTQTRMRGARWLVNQHGA